MFKKIFWFGMPRDKNLSLGLVVSALQAVTAAGLLATSGWLISRAAEQPPVMYLMVAVVMVRFFALGKASFRYLERLLTHDSTLRAQAGIRPKLFESLIPFSGVGLMQNSSRNSLSSLVDDVDELQNLPTRVLSPIAQALAVTLAAVAVTFLLLPSAAIALLASVAIAGFVVAPVTTLIASNQARSISFAKNELSLAIDSLLTNLQIAKAYGWHGALERRVNEAQRQFDIKARRLALAQGIGQSFMAIISTLSCIVAAWLAAEAVTNKAVTEVNLAVIALLPLAVFDVLQGILPVGGSWIRYRAAALRVMRLMEREVPEVLRPLEGSVTISSFSKATLNNVSVKYPESNSEILRNFNFQLRAGETVSIVGQSGSGKSTLAKLLIGHIRPTFGSYEVNGIASEKLNNLQEIVGYLEQSPMILLGTVKSNLLIANEKASDQELWDVLNQVGLAEMFADRQGLDTQLGELGVLISGGEAQRLAMARLLLKDFKVLILDEPTANVDEQQADVLIGLLLKLAKQEGRAVVLITHQLEYSALTQRTIEIG